MGGRCNLRRDKGSEIVADFVQTMKDWERMCDTFKSCDDCPMMNEDGWAHILCSEGGISNAEPEKSVEIITQWAAEHPEPVYPTWTEYFRMTGVFPSWSGHEILNNTPIPANIAEKLGIEPKGEL